MNIASSGRSMPGLTTNTRWMSAPRTAAHTRISEPQQTTHNNNKTKTKNAAPPTFLPRPRQLGVHLLEEPGAADQAVAETDVDKAVPGPYHCAVQGGEGEELHVVQQLRRRGRQQSRTEEEERQTAAGLYRDVMGTSAHTAQHTKSMTKRSKNKTQNTHTETHRHRQKQTQTDTDTDRHTSETDTEKTEKQTPLFTSPVQEVTLPQIVQICGLGFCEQCRILFAVLECVRRRGAATFHSHGAATTPFRALLTLKL